MPLPLPLPHADPSKMDYANRHNKPKAWKEVWSAGQGVGNINDAPPAAEVIDRMKAEYRAARENLAAF